MFKTLKTQLQANFNRLSKEDNLFYVSIDREVIWEKYLSGFSTEVERQDNNCNCCKSFMRQWGGIVGIEKGKRVSIWEGIDVPEFNQSVKNVLEYIDSLPISDVFYEINSSCGTDKNFDMGRNVTWEHFHLNLPKKFILSSGNIDSKRGELRTAKDTFSRALKELKLDATETILELVAQKSLYRGNDYEGVLNAFRKVQLAYAELNTDAERETFLWSTSVKVGGAVTSIRNGAIGTLLINLSENMDLDVAVTKFEAVVAPTNYKRPTALTTPKMVEQAKVKLEALGLLESLNRRFANETDLSVEQFIWADKSSQLTDIFSEMVKESSVNPKTLSKVEEITIDDFLEKVVPTAKSIEVLLENSHLGNLVSLVTSEDKDVPSLFKWDNNFSWCYTGGVTDSIKERVKAAGGNVEGHLRVSLSWFNYDDLDIHVIEPNGNKIYFLNHRKPSSAPSSGQLDVDMNAGGGSSKTPVENITWSNKDKMLEGKYTVLVNNYVKRDSKDGGYIVQVECNGEIFDFEVDKSPKNNGTDIVVTFNYSKTEGVTMDKESKSTSISKEKWNLKTNQFHKVKNLLISPNQWANKVGSKHYFLTIDGCVNDEAPRPIFNEFLKEEFNENRKVFEVMGSKLKINSTVNQLSGIGFSETQRKSFIVRVEGKFKRLLKVKI